MRSTNCGESPRYGDTEDIFTLRWYRREAATPITAGMRYRGWSPVQLARLYGRVYRNSVICANRAIPAPPDGSPYQMTVTIWLALKCPWMSR